MDINQSTSAEEIAALLDRYLLNLDDDELDDAWAERLFTKDACVEFPISRHEGIDGLAAYHRDALAMFEKTQHLNSPAVVELDGDRASLRANLLSTHVHLRANAPSGGGHPPLFATGTLVNGEACHTPDGWRLRLLSFRLVWATGSPPRPAQPSP
jgi:SnoaL-like domain